MTAAQADKASLETSPAAAGDGGIIEVEQQPVAGVRRGSWRVLAVRVARIVFTLAVIAGVAYTTATQWRDVKAYLFNLAWHSVALSLLMVLVSLGAGALAWRAALAAVGHRVGVRTASQIYLIGLLAKYLPGSVWAFLLQMELGKRANLPRPRSFLASIVTVGIGVTVSLAFGVFGLPALSAVGGGVAVGLAVLVPVSLVCAHPRVLTRLVQILLRLLRRPALEKPFTWPGVGKVAGWSAVSLAASGAHLWLLAGSESAPGLIGLARCVGAIGLAMTVGLFAFLVPSGLGVREAIIVATLLPYVPNAGVALGMALASRLIFILGDLIAAAAAAASGFGDFRQRLLGKIGSMAKRGRQTPRLRA